MMTPVSPANTCAGGWLSAVNCISAAGGDAYNVIVDIHNPVHHTEQDRVLIMRVDQFLRSRNANPISTVANTIFPQDLYRRYGAGAMRTEYLRAYDRIRKKGWGRYFERMVRWPGKNGETTDQLADLVERIKNQLRARQTFRNVYEMSLFDPVRDPQRNRNRQCLSFLSFKLDPERRLMLTAMYRNHHYIARALGNFIGLGNLMRYIAAEAGTTVGSLTCVSTHAEIDTASAKDDSDGVEAACRGWTISDVRALIRALSADSRLEETKSAVGLE